MRYFAILILVFALSATFAYSQDTGGSRTNRREDPLQRKLQGAVQLELIEAAMMSRPATPAVDRSAVLNQIRKDFQRIQFANDDLINALSGKTTFDLRVISKAAAEIRSRAKRLKQNLALPAPPRDSEPPPPAVEENLRSSMAQLSKLIGSFVSNPMLSQRHVFDATLSLKASRDLEGIIDSSARLKKAAEKNEASR
jgi:hypothetical protein